MYDEEEGIDLYFDNVGGKHLAALDNWTNHESSNTSATATTVQVV
jgi:hypothetical protein